MSFWTRLDTKTTLTCNIITRGNLCDRRPPLNIAAVVLLVRHGDIDHHSKSAQYPATR